MYSNGVGQLQSLGPPVVLLVIALMYRERRTTFTDAEPQKYSRSRRTSAQANGLELASGTHTVRMYVRQLQPTTRKLPGTLRMQLSRMANTEHRPDGRGPDNTTTLVQIVSIDTKTANAHA